MPVETKSAIKNLEKLKIEKAKHMYKKIIAIFLILNYI